MKRYIKSAEDMSFEEVKTFSKEHKNEVIDFVIHTFEPWEVNFQDACVDKMIELLEEQGIYVSDISEDYLLELFQGYDF